MKTKSIQVYLTGAILSLIFIGCGGENGSDTTTETPSLPSGFTKTSNTYSSNDSNLTWQDNAEVYTIGADSNSEASQICVNKTIDGFSDWRLPTALEVFNFYAKNRVNLSYTYEDYKNETYFDTLKLRHLTWTNYYRQSNYTSNSFGVINEIIATRSGEDEYSSMFLPAEGSQSGQAYSIRCVRDN